VEVAGQGYRHRRRRAKKLRRRAAGLGILGAVFLAGAAPARAEARATVTPNTNLSNGDTVTVSWTGGPPGALLNIFQCAQPPSTRTCAVGDGVMNVVNGSTGDGMAPITVRTGPIGDSGAQCPGPANDCVIVINVGGSEAADANFVLPISFTSAPAADMATRTELARTGPVHLGLALTGGGVMLAGLVLVKMVEVPPSVPAPAAPAPRNAWRRTDDDIFYRRRRYQPKHLRRR
jgi:hypothetical protein